MDIEAWLQGLGLERYVQAFRDNEIDWEVLPKLTADDLTEIGVTAVGHRRKLLDAIASLGTSAPTAAVSAAISAASARADAERRQLTVMFCDLVGSTPLSARLDPEDLRGIIGTYHRCVTEIVESFAGFVARYMGDGVLVYFGYPQAHEDDAERATRCGLALVDRVPRLDQTEKLHARVGIATGLVVVGGEIVEHDVAGDTPNLAARLQALAEPGTVVIAPSTRRLTGGLFDYDDLGPVEIKGLAAPVEASRVLRESGAESRFEALRAARTPLVGRDEELALLQRRWRQARTGEGCVVLVSGEPGIGKSRLAQTLVEQLSGEPHTRLRLFCSPHHPESALHPTITQLERAAGFRREDTADQRLDKLEAVLCQAASDLGEAAPLIAAMLSLPTSERYPPLDLTPQKQKEKTLQALVAQVEGLAARQPVLMLVEDAHWSDPTSLDLLDLIIDRVSALRVLLIITYRPEFSPPWAGRPQVTSLGLNRLAPRQGAEMITGVTGGRALPKEITDQIIDRSDGVPLFVEELTKAVVESGMLTDAGDRYTRTGPMAALAIPASLQASLLARLDRLAPAREVVQIGAALGRQFSHELIAVVAPMPQRQLDDVLAQLVGAELIYRRGIPPDAEYTFKHVLVQDAAYSTLLRSRRRQLHARIVATLEDRFPEIVVAQPALLAHHCEEAGLSENAVAYWLAAGRQAWAHSATAEAVALLRRGLALIPALPDDDRRRETELDLLIALRPPLGQSKGLAAAEVGQALARARALAEAVDRPEQLIALLWGQGLFHTYRSEHTRALAIAEQMENIGEARYDFGAKLRGRLLRGWTCYLLGEFVAGRALQEECLDIADPARRVISRDTHALALGVLASTLAILGYLDQAHSRLNEALAASRKLGHPYTTGAVVAQAGTGFDRSPELQRWAEELLALATEHGFPLFAAWATTFRGRSLCALGQALDGHALLAEGLASIRATGAVTWTPTPLAWLAEACAALGQPDAALNHLDEAAQLIAATGERFYEAELHRVRGDLLYAAADRSAGERSYRRAIAVADRQGAKLLQLRAVASLARFWREEGKRTQARGLLAPVYGWFTEGFGTPVLQEAKALLAELA
jgi:class 3 adenylate cyclase/tetratricopeptide (TPR) repeat protein